MKPILFAYRDFGYRCVEYLIKNNEKEFVVVVPAVEKGTTFMSVSDLCKDNGITHLNYNKKKKPDELQSFVTLHKPDFGFSCYFPYKIEPAIINLLSKNLLNIHGGILPLYRGALSSVWSILNDEAYAGASLHYITDELDMGNILDVRKCRISNMDTGYSLYKKVEELSFELFIEYFEKMRSGKTNFLSVSQIKEQGKYYSRALPNNGIIDWNNKARFIYNFCRSLDFPSYDPAITYLKEEKVGLRQCEETKVLSLNLPGTIIFLPTGHIEVTTKDYNLKISDKKFIFKIRALNGKRFQ